MRLLVLSDIHGNLVALDSVLREVAQESFDQILCLGDVSSLGPQPREVLDRLRQLQCAVVLGNTDAWLLAPPQATAADSADRQILCAINAWCADQLSAADRAYLRTFSFLLERPLDAERTLLAYHGSPRSFDDVIAAVTPDASVAQMLAGRSVSVLVGGHTHIQLIRRYQDAHLVNVGSIGLPGVNAGGPDLPMNHRVHWAEYGVVSVEGGRLSIELRRTPLDMPAVLAAAHASTMPHLAWWLGKWG